MPYTGETPIEKDDYVIVAFKESGEWEIPEGVSQVDVLVVAGGGGRSNTTTRYGGGAGDVGGEYRGVGLGGHGGDGLFKVGDDTFVDLFDDANTGENISDEYWYAGGGGGAGSNTDNSGSGGTGGTVTTNDGQIDHNSLTNTHNLTTDIDHNSLQMWRIMIYG